VKKRKVPRKVPDFFRAEEVPPVLASLPDRWRPLFATALYTGLRKGELIELRKADVDLPNRPLTALRGGRDRLLAVGEVAEQLGVCAATVYWLCERGDLPHLRIINSIRVRPQDLATFLTKS